MILMFWKHWIITEDNMNKTITETGELKSTGSFIRMMIVYFTVCLLGLAVMITAINSLMREHDKKLTGQICDLVAEKMNNSIKYMTTSAQNMSAMLTAQKHSDIQLLYNEFSDLKGDGYISMGLIDSRDKVYATDTELDEFRKWRLLEIARKADPVSISSPYRSGFSGEPVITLFAEFRYGKEEKGCLFLTYPLKEIQNMASTETLADDTEIWLMDSESDNVIQCAGKNKYAIGSWANAMLIFDSKIEKKDVAAFEKWKESMHNDERAAGVVYRIGDVTYSQVYADINFMHGWNVVVRMPSSAMSSAMERFRSIVILYIVLLLLATIVMFLLTHRRDVADREILKNLSIHDPLTDVMNRRALDVAANNYFQRMLRPECAVLFIDVDYFKQVNDRYGHDAGDKVLKEFAALLKDLFGDIGLISRYGGDEFLVFIKNADKQKIEEKLAELTLRAHEIRPITRREDDYYSLSCSCGGAMCPDNAKNFEQLKACADAALYEVKDHGRDGYGWDESSGSR